MVSINIKSTSESQASKKLKMSVYFLHFLTAVDVDKTNVKFVSHKSGIASTQIAVGVVVGVLALAGVMALLTGLVVYRLKAKGYEKVPLLSDE